VTPGSERFFIEPQNEDEPRIEAVLHLISAQTAPGVVICHPHPLYGGDMDSHVVTALCDALVASGTAALRFNFRGSGSSTGGHDGGRGERRDALRALAHLAARAEIDGERLGIAGYSFGATVASSIAEPARARFLVSPPRLVDGAALPTLVITGEHDQIASPSSLKDGDGYRLEVVPGADHFWGSGLDQLRRRAGEFFREHLA
jgi:uncharacterized protein